MAADAPRKPRFYEFFAGGGLVRAALRGSWECLFANDFDRKKAKTYHRNWGDDELIVGDVRDIALTDLPAAADLAWASFPCQDLSLAGGGAGLAGERSGTFWPFWKLMQGLGNEQRAPRVIILENVCGTLTSHGGKDFAAIAAALAKEVYRTGALVMDAELFVPHSRPRLFVVGVRDELDLPDGVLTEEPNPLWHTASVRRAAERVASDRWIWWNPPKPRRRRNAFLDLVEDDPESVSWQTAAETKKLIGMMSDLNREKLRQAQQSGERQVGTIYKRTRRDSSGRKVQRAEARFDGVAGCLRTPAGGSSRQLVIVVEGKTVRSRLISSRETARLMGLKDSYALPDNYNEAYHLTGDGVVVPVVRHLVTKIVEPILAHQHAEVLAL
mgnify:FL=1